MPASDSPSNWAKYDASRFNNRELLVSLQGRELFPLDCELLFRQALVAQEMGKLSAAVRLYRDVLHRPDERHFSSIDPDIAGYKTRHNLAVTYGQLDRPGLAEIEWRTILSERPGYRTGWRALADTLLRQGKLTTLEVELERWPTDVGHDCEALLQRGQLKLRRGDLAAGREMLSSARGPSRTANAWAPKSCS